MSELFIHAEVEEAKQIAYEEGFHDGYNQAMSEMPEVVRCKDCKHRPKKPNNYRSGFDLDFPDSKCPCQCSDGYYSWYPKDDWSCGWGERKEQTDG